MATRFVIVSALVAAAAWLAVPSPADACEGFEPGGQMAGTVEHRRITEASGLVASRRAQNRFWTHNDSSGAARLYALDAKGRHVAAAELPNGLADDWEDMAAGPCQPGGEQTCLYVADIGDNGTDRESVVIYRTPEPEIPEETSTTLTLEAPTVHEYRYPEGPRDAETLMVHPETGALYVVEKTGAEKAGVYRVPRAAADEDSPPEADQIGTLSVNRGLQGHVTGGDISPDGDEFSIRTYIKVFTYCTDGDDFETIFEAEPVESHPRFTIQSESLAYGPAGESLWFTSEGRRAPLVRMGRPD